MKKMRGVYYMPHPPIVIPKVGLDEHVKCNQSYNAMLKVGKEISSIKPKRIIIISPHGTVFSDGIAILYNEKLTGNLSQFGCEEIALTQASDKPFIDALTKRASDENIICAKVDDDFAIEHNISVELDHGAIVPLWFVNQFYSDYSLVHITYGLLSVEKLYQLGKCIQEIIKRSDCDSVVIASGDMSHALKDSGPYHYHQDGVDFDKAMVEAIKEDARLDILTYPLSLRQNACECGFRSLCIMLGVLDTFATKNTVYSYESPFGVGYAVASLMPTGNFIAPLSDDMQVFFEREKIKKRNLEDDYIKLARTVVNAYVINKSTDEINLDHYAIEEKASACFVSIKSEGELRGCIGTLSPRYHNLKREILENAISASTRDYRFNPIAVDELDNLTFTVDIILKPERIYSKSDLDPDVYGVIVIQGEKQGVLLPNLENVNSVDEQLNIAKNKAGIKGDDYLISRFKVIRHAVD